MKVGTLAGRFSLPAPFCTAVRSRTRPSRFCGSICFLSSGPSVVSAMTGSDLFQESAAMPQGKVKRLVADRGFGFLETDRGDDLFFHHSEVQGATIEQLREGPGGGLRGGTRPQGTVRHADSSYRGRLMRLLLSHR